MLRFPAIVVLIWPANPRLQHPSVKTKGCGNMQLTVLEKKKRKAKAIEKKGRTVYG